MYRRTRYLHIIAYGLIDDTLAAHSNFGLKENIFADVIHHHPGNSLGKPQRQTNRILIRSESKTVLVLMSSECNCSDSFQNKQIKVAMDMPYN